MKIAIATVFLPRENIYWLEEWVRYHLFYIGIDSIYLYDNTGSQRLDHLPFNPEIAIALSGKNLKGESVASHTAHLTDEDIARLTGEIVSKYNGRVVLVPWHPVDEKGIPCYGQREAFKHFLETKGKSFDWVCFTDVDEFILNQNFKDQVSRFNEKGFNDLFIHPKLFMQRFGQKGPIVPALSITDCIEKISDRNWKQVIKCSDIISPNIHQGGEWKGECKPVFHTGLSFYHYKVGPGTYQKMRDEILCCPKKLKVGTDDTLKKILPTLGLENGVFIPLPREIHPFEPGPRVIELPPISSGRKIQTLKEYAALYAVFHSRLIRRLWFARKKR